MHSRPRSRRASVAATLWGTVVYLTDCTPPRVRYGYVHRAGRDVIPGPDVTLRAPAGVTHSTDATAAARPQETIASSTTCVLASDGLDVGGIGTVVDMLARGLGAHGVRPVVVCQGDGPRAASLRRAGIEVVSVPDEPSAKAALSRIHPDVIQSHSAPPFLERAAMRSGIPLVPVMHNTEIHYTRARWSAFASLMTASASGIAVSETVREFHLRRVGPRTPIAVIPNGAPVVEVPGTTERGQARTALANALGVDIGDDVVFVCLARYDAQKNIAGLVASFTSAVEQSEVPIRLVCAGDASDRVEFRRADALRCAGAASDRIHLLGDSDAATLLTAADAFILDSFFEGWPVAATEAAAFGLPLLLSDVGGARELVKRDPLRSVLIENASGDATAVDDRRVRTARRRSRRQGNASELREAVRRISNTVIAERSGDIIRTPLHDGERAGTNAMLAQHAEVIRAAAATAIARENESI